MTGPTTTGATASIEWTGERCVPWAPDYQVIYEHYHRYAWAASHLPAGAKVLDLASGEGYGSDLLRRHGFDVTGVEIDAAAVAHARAAYPDIPFEQGDMRELGDHLQGFDAVVCFEALEHVVEHEALVAGVRRALVPGGVFFVSTPDKDVYLEHGGHGHNHGHEHDHESHESENPYHLRELNLAEFDVLLGTHFGNHRVYEQRFAVGSVIHDARTGGGETELRGIRQVPSGWTEQAAPPATYLLGVASDSPLPPTGTTDVLLDPDITAVRAEQRTIFDLRDEIQQRDELVAALEARLVEAESHDWRVQVRRLRHAVRR